MEQKQQTVESLTMRKVAWRILPFVTVGYFLASLDRVNIAFAALQMKQDIALGDAAFGFGAGLFFIAYCLFAVPANMMLERFGPVRWLAFTMVSWGSSVVAWLLCRDLSPFTSCVFCSGWPRLDFFLALSSI